MAIADFTTNTRYALMRACDRASRAVEEVTLTDNSFLYPEADARLAELYNLLRSLYNPGAAFVVDGQDISVYFGSDVPAPGFTVAKVVDGVLVQTEFDGTIGTVKSGQSFDKLVRVDNAAADTYSVLPTVVNGNITLLRVNSDSVPIA